MACTCTSVCCKSIYSQTVKFSINKIRGACGPVAKVQTFLSMVIGSIPTSGSFAVHSCHGFNSQVRLHTLMMKYTLQGISVNDCENQPTYWDRPPDTLLLVWVSHREVDWSTLISKTAQVTGGVL